MSAEAEPKAPEPRVDPIQSHVDTVINDMKSWPGTSKSQEEALGRALQDRRVGRIGRP